MGKKRKTAAGNGNDSGDEEYASHYPSSYENVISVCAIQCSGSWGGWATYHPTVDLAAPGENVYSAIMNGGYASWMRNQLEEGMLYMNYRGYVV